METDIDKLAQTAELMRIWKLPTPERKPPKQPALERVTDILISLSLGCLLIAGFVWAGWAFVEWVRG